MVGGLLTIRSLLVVSADPFDYDRIWYKLY